MPGPNLSWSVFVVGTRHENDMTCAIPALDFIIVNASMSKSLRLSRSTHRQFGRRFASEVNKISPTIAPVDTLPGAREVLHHNSRV